MPASRVKFFEIPANHPEQLAKFYAEHFGWKVQKSPTAATEYWLCDTGQGEGISGAILKRVNAYHTVTNYIRVENLDEAVEKTKKLGANLTTPKTAVPGQGWFATAVDPQGNPYGLWQDDKNAK